MSGSDSTTPLPADDQQPPNSGAQIQGDQYNLGDIDGKAVAVGPHAQAIYNVIQQPAPPPKPQLPYEPETILIPAGPFLMGADEHSPFEAPAHQVELPAFRIGKFPVTNAQYAQFISQTGRNANKELLWDGNQPAPAQDKLPVQGVTWYDALAYCEWLSEATGRTYTLPNEAQWEKAARGNDGYLYPWGNQWEPDRCNHDPTCVTAVDDFPPQTPLGCYDLVGNLREWTTTLWGNAVGQPDPRYQPPWAADNRDSLQAPATTRRIFRGGHGRDHGDYRCSRRGSYLPQRHGPSGQRHGFRIIQIIPPEEAP